MRFLLGLLIGLLLGGVVGVALCSSGKLNADNCGICRLFSNECGTDAPSKP